MLATATHDTKLGEDTRAHQRAVGNPRPVVARASSTPTTEAPWTSWHSPGGSTTVRCSSPRRSSTTLPGSRLPTRGRRPASSCPSSSTAGRSTIGSRAPRSGRLPPPRGVDLRRSGLRYDPDRYSHVRSCVTPAVAGGSFLPPPRGLVRPDLHWAPRPGWNTACTCTHDPGAHRTHHPRRQPSWLS